MKQPYFAFQWHITEACDQRCKHCYIFAGHEEKALASMRWEDMTTVLDQIDDFCTVYGRQPYLYLTGGDPILHPDFWPLLELLALRKIPFTIMGNPFHLTPETCARMHRLGCRRYQLSIDGIEATHDWFRRPGSYQATLAAIPMINASGMRSLVMTTVSGRNIDEVPGICDAVVQAGAKVWAFARYCPTSEEKTTDIAPLRYRELLAVLDAKFRAYEAQGVDTWFNRKDHLWTLYQYETGAFQIPKDADPDTIYAGCNCGNGHITILPNGDIYACRRVKDSRVGSIFTDRLADVWVSEMEAYRDYGRFAKCSRCELKAWCRGCPGVASGTSGDFYAADPQCWKQVEGYDESEEAK